MAFCAGDGSGEPVLIEATVGKAGELVMQGEPLVIVHLALEEHEHEAHGDGKLMHVPHVAGKLFGDAAPAGHPGMRAEADRPQGEAKGNQRLSAAALLDFVSKNRGGQ